MSVRARPCLIRLVAAVELRHIRLIHQHANAVMLPELEVSIIAMSVEAVCVRLMVLAVIGSHLAAHWASVNSSKRNY